MNLVQVAGLRYYQSESFKNKIIHGFFTRQGGVSPNPWHSLNVGGLIGDERVNVVENRRRIFDAVNLPVETIFDVWQVHGKGVVITDRSRQLSEPHLRADAILTDRINITLFMRFADCVPVMLYDPYKQVIGLIHAGWPGTVKKICSEAVKEMLTNFNCHCENILAVIGPSIGPDHYEIKQDVQEQIAEAFNFDISSIIIQRDGRFFLDLWKANWLILEQAGIKHIEVMGICTGCNTQDWYSHRVETGNTGRFGALIVLTE